MLARQDLRGNASVPCSSCGKPISELNILPHEAYCSRYITRCRGCGCLVDLKDEETNPHQCGASAGDGSVYPPSNSKMLEESDTFTQNSLGGGELLLSQQFSDHSNSVAPMNDLYAFRGLSSDSESDNSHASPYQIGFHQMARKRQRPEQTTSFPWQEQIREATNPFKKRKHK